MIRETKCLLSGNLQTGRKMDLKQLRRYCFTLKSKHIGGLQPSKGMYRDCSQSGHNEG